MVLLKDGRRVLALHQVSRTIGHRIALGAADSPSDRVYIALSGNYSLLDWLVEYTILVCVTDNFRQTYKVMVIELDESVEV